MRIYSLNKNTNKRGATGLEILLGVVTSLFVIGLLVMIFVLAVGGLNDTQELKTYTDYVQTFFTESVYTLTHSVYDVDNTTKRNDTWLNFNGVNDSVAIPSTITESLTFWYKNETSDWFFVANSSGTLYVDGVVDTPNQYPVYHNGTHYIFGKENATSFLNVSIDDPRGYNSTIDTSLINLIFNGGRA